MQGTVSLTIKIPLGSYPKCANCPALPIGGVPIDDGARWRFLCACCFADWEIEDRVAADGFVRLLVENALRGGGR